MSTETISPMLANVRDIVGDDADLSGELVARGVAEGKAIKRRHARFVAWISVGRIGVIIVVIAAWQWIPQIHALSSRFKLLDPFFISSPSQIATRLGELTFGTQYIEPMWSALSRTVLSALTGAGIALVVGTVFGLVMSHYRVLDALSRPYAIALNAIPKVTIIPLIIIVFGSSWSSDAINSFLTVVFLVFFNALRGGGSVPQEVLENLRLMGASSGSIMWRIRLPYVAAWIFAQLPNVVSFALVATVTAELLTGTAGLGSLLVTAMGTSDATLTFALVVTLMAVGVCLVLLAQFVEHRLFPWINSVRSEQ